MSPSKIFDILEKIAVDVVPVASARIAAAVVKKNEIISFGTNSLKSHPFQLKYAKNKQSIYWHAENRATYQAINRIGREELKNCSLYVFRIKYDDTAKGKWIPGLAKPCPGCEECINEHQFKKLYYSLDNKGYACI